MQESAGLSSVHLYMMKLKGQHQLFLEPMGLVFAPDNVGVVEVTIGIGAFIQSSKAIFLDVFCGSTSFISLIH
nr:hypothetical protein [Prevotella sp.]